MDTRTLLSQIGHLRDLFTSAGFNLRHLQQLALEDYAILSFKAGKAPSLALSETTLNDPMLQHRVLAVAANAIITGVALARVLVQTGNGDTVMQLGTEYAFNASNINPGTVNTPIPPLPLEWRLVSMTAAHAEAGYLLVEAFENSQREVKPGPMPNPVVPLVNGKRVLAHQSH